MKDTTGDNQWIHDEFPVFRDGSAGVIWLQLTGSTATDELNQFQGVAVLEDGCRMGLRSQNTSVQFHDNPSLSQLQQVEKFNDIQGISKGSELTVDMESHLSFLY
jgi:hypothetical protein